MAVIYCHTCDHLIDLDWDVDHEYECRLEHGLEPEEEYTETREKGEDE